MSKSSMKTYSIKAIVAYKGKYKIIDADILRRKVPDKKLKSYLKDKTKPNEIMKSCVAKGYDEQVSFGINLCGACKNMLKCPKVLDTKKRSLEKYPYITAGLELVLMDVEKNKAYKNALKQYKELNQESDFNIDDYPKIKESLSDNGIEVPLITVFSCSRFVDDGYREVYSARFNMG